MLHPLRLLDAAPELGVTDTQERVNPDLDRKKRVISREAILKQGEALMSELAGSRSLLEIHYEGEVGTGLGPTLEFYSLVSKELQRADLQLWKGATVKIGTEDVMEEEEAGSRDCVEYVYSDTGLYPLPIARNCKSSHKSKIKNKFQFLGKFMAKAVLDNRYFGVILLVFPKSNVSHFKDDRSPIFSTFLPVAPRGRGDVIQLRKYI